METKVSDSQQSQVPEEPAVVPQENTGATPVFADFTPATSTAPDILGANDTAKRLSFNGGFLISIFARTRAYIPEYAVLLIFTGTLLGIVNGLFSGSIDYIADPKPNPTWGGGWEYTYSLGMLAAALVLIPALIALTKRIKGTESDDGQIKNLSWRKGFLGVFLIIISLTALGYGIALLYQIISQIAGAGLVSATKGIWKSYLKDIFGLGLFGITAWLYTRDYRYSEEDADGNHLLLAKIHRYGLTLLAVFLAIVFNMTALKAQRNNFIDNLISDDITSIQTKVAAYEAKNRKQVKALDEVKLSDEETSRIKKYGYEYSKSSTGYKLCAVFKTDTSDKKPSDGSVTALEQALSSSSSSRYSSGASYADPTVHDKGRVCFDYKTTVSNSVYDSSSSLYDNSYNYDLTQ